MHAIRPHLLLLTGLTFAACVAPTELDEASIDVPDDVPPLSSRFVRHTDAIAGRYLVVLAAPRHRAAPGGPADRAELDASIDRLATTYAANVGERFLHAVRGFGAVLTEADARALSDDPAVAFVEEDAPVWADAMVRDDATWGLDRIDQRDLPLDTRYTALDDGDGVTAYIIDSGIRATHVEVAGRVLPGFSSIDDGRGTGDCTGHGTHVAGTVGGTSLGVAGKVRLVPVRVLGCEGGTLTSVVAGLEWVLANRLPRSVANMSIYAPPSDIVDAAVRSLIAAGTPTVVSAGNNATDACGQSPARLPDAITVAATGVQDARAPFSNHGPCVDLHAPGVDIVSADFTGDTLMRPLSGTSMAAPHVAGAVALYLGAHPSATPQDVPQALLEGTTPGKVTDLRGSPDRLLHTRFVDLVAPEVAIQAPLANAEVPPTFRVVASAIDPNLATVALSIDGQIVQTLEAPPFEFQITNLAEGPHALTITGIDAGMSSSQTSIEIRVTPATDAPGEALGSADPADAPTIEGGCAAGGGGAGLLVGLAGIVLGRRRQRPAASSAATSRRALG